MTRIISGIARGLTLDVPGAGTRPTSDRVRESLFGALETADAITDARVLDLYAGSGALGLEAGSRGARSVDLVELNHKAASVATRNAAKVAHASAPRAAVHTLGVAPFLRHSTATWDLVFIDPPYGVSEDEIETVLTLLAPRLSPDALVVVERDKRSGEPRWANAGLEAWRDKTYGDTTVWWGGLPES